MTAIVEVSGNRFVCIVACDSATVLAKPSSQLNIFQFLQCKACHIYLHDIHYTVCIFMCLGVM